MHKYYWIYHHLYNTNYNLQKTAIIGTACHIRNMNGTFIAPVNSNYIDLYSNSNLYRCLDHFHHYNCVYIFTLPLLYPPVHRWTKVYQRTAVNWSLLRGSIRGWRFVLSKLGVCKLWPCVVCVSCRDLLVV